MEKENYIIKMEACMMANGHMEKKVGSALCTFKITKKYMKVTGETINFMGKANSIMKISIKFLGLLIILILTI